MLEAEPYRRLSYTWHTFTPEWADAFDLTDETRERLAAEPRSKVTFEIEPLDGEQVKLTVVHDGLEPDGVARLDDQRGLAARARPTSRRCSRPARRCRDSPEPRDARGLG